MNKKYLKIISFSIIGLIFLFIAFGSGEEDKKSEWVKNSKEMFADKKFRDSHSVDQIGMDVKTETILNNDGTYTSKEEWSADSDYTSDYNTTVGHSSGTNDEFSGTWQIVDKFSAEDLSKLANPSESTSSDETLIKYTSNLGKTRYARIYKYESLIWLALIPFETDIHDKSFTPKDLDMYQGSFYAD